jgi:hypothetical protein
MKNDYCVLSKNKDFERLKGLDEFFIVALDPAIKNFGMSIESRSWDGEASTVSLFKFGVRTERKNNKTKLFTDLTKTLDEYEEWWPHISLVIVEKQMTKNPDATQIAYYATSYFLFNCPDAIVVEINPKLKTKVLGGPTGYAAVKRWSVVKGKEILRERNDKFGLSQLKGEKLDDMTDTLVESEAFIKYLKRIFG